MLHDESEKKNEDTQRMQEQRLFEDTGKILQKMYGCSQVLRQDYGSFSEM